ncbi:MAG TPA: lysozyme inhibitor LprI family protein [Alphaproteobacteria bacterium]|nr:lysozyme inhibitor LprI family protein [Alphaproteobacteria bacterium]
MTHQTVRLTAALIIAAGTMGAASATAVTPSFDCKRAGTASERAICRIERLGFRDRALGQLYRRLMARLPAGQRAGLRKEQARWLAGRERACGAERVCLERRYEARIDALSRRAARTAGRSAFTGRYRATKGLGGYIYLIDMAGPRVMAELETVNPSTSHQCTMHMLTARLTGAVIRWSSPEARACVVTIVNKSGGVDVSGPPACQHHCGLSGFFSGFYRKGAAR